MSLYKENYSAYMAEYTRKNYDRIEVKVPKGYKDWLKEQIKPQSMNSFIIEAIQEKLEWRQ